MLALKRIAFPVLFFSCIVISSCVLFSSKSYLSDFPHNEEIKINAINLFGKLSYTKSNNGTLLLLISNNDLKCVVYNKNRNNHLYQYSKINDTTHLLFAKKSWSGFGRYSQTEIDSILFKGNRCIRKQEAKDSKTNHKFYVQKIEVFEAIDGTINSYQVARPDLINYKESNLAVLIEDFKKLKHFTPIQESKVLTKETFFRERIINSRK